MKKMTTFLKPTNLYDEAIRRYQELLQLKQTKENAIAKAPPGKIRLSQSKNRAQFYLRKNKEEKTGEYISKTNAAMLKNYLQKSYDENALKLINQEISVLEAFLRKSNCFIESLAQVQADQVNGSKAQVQADHIAEISTKNQTNHKESSHLSQPIIKIRQIYSNYPEEAKNYIHPIDMSDEDYANYWRAMPYKGKEVSEYVTCYETNNKEKVRSKSELNIANALAAHGIPYKYECPLLFKNGVTIYPDFTILNIKKRKEMYWEHRGMMDEKDYARNSVSRIKTYLKNGYYLGNDLIITEETSATPLGTDEIDAVINNCFKDC